jgi:C-terminal processing protease CtpA/Prc
MSLTRSDREQLLSKIQSLVQEQFYDPAFNGKKWNQIVDHHRQRIIDSNDTDAFEAAVAEMLSELNSSGLGLLGPRTKITPRNAINASFHSVPTEHEGQRWIFQDVLPGGVSERAGARPGDALISVHGKGVTPPQKPAFPMGERIPVVISRNGQRRETHIELSTPQPKYKDNPYAEPKSITARIVDGSIGQVKVSLFPGKLGIDFANEIEAMFSGELSVAERLVVDLRGNPGGGVGGLRLMSLLTADKTPVGYSLDRPTAERGYDREKLPRFGKIPRSKWEIPLLALKYGAKKSVALETEGLGKKKFHGRVVVLVNEHSTGAAEMVTQFAKENNLATIVGTRTPGHLVARSPFKIGFGYQLTIPIGAYISWKGSKIEGQGIQPDVPVQWSYEDALKGIDNQLDEAVRTVKSL